jgi:pseudaminic acid cytidylyltransferase
MGNYLAIILARGGSRRVPGKNLREFCGLPMVAWPVKAAVESGLFKAVVVSTDDEAIREAAMGHGATAIRRPPELCGDGIPAREAEIHAIREMTEGLGGFDAVCSMTGTSAFVGPKDLRRGLEALDSGNWEFAVSVLEYPHPPQRALRLRKDGSLEMARPQFATTRTQDLEPRWHDAGQFYWGRIDAFLGRRSSLASRSIPVVLSRSRVVDIDRPDDWQIAETIKRMAQESGLLGNL